MHVPGQCGRAAIAADLGCSERISLVIGAQPAVLLGNSDTEQADAVQIAIVLGREHRVAIIGCGAAGEHALTDLLRPRDDGCLLAVQTECDGIEDRRIERELVGCAALADLLGHCPPACVLAALDIRKSSIAASNASGRSRLAR